MANSAFDSNNTALVKEHLRRMVSVQVEWSTRHVEPEAGTQVGHLDAGRGCGNSRRSDDGARLGRVLLRAEDQKEAAGPGSVQYARLSLQFQSQLRSSAGLALYETCVRYLINPSHLTMRETWEWWRPILSGTPDTEAGDEAKREYIVLRLACHERRGVSPRTATCSPLNQSRLG